jgi:hypothetical protein
MISLHAKEGWENAEKDNNNVSTFKVKIYFLMEVINKTDF